MTKCIKQQALESIEAHAAHTISLIESNDINVMTLYFRIDSIQKAARNALNAAKKEEDEYLFSTQKPAYNPGEWVWEDGQRDWDSVTEWWVEDKKLSLKNSLRSSIAVVKRKRHLPLIVHAPRLLRAARRVVSAGSSTDMIDHGIAQEALRELASVIQLATSRLGDDTYVPPMKPRASDVPEPKSAPDRLDQIKTWEERDSYDRKEAWDKYRTELEEWEREYGREL